VGLSKAISSMHADRATETVLRDVLVTFRRHPREWLSPDSVARDAGRPRSEVEAILLTLAECFVLDFDRQEGRFRYQPDGLLELDISDYLRRVDTINDRLQHNVARFRLRSGYE
jgi:DNA-binding IclR family transcriptional regulator